MGFSEDVAPLLIGLFEVIKSILLWPFPKSRKNLKFRVLLEGF